MHECHKPLKMYCIYTLCICIGGHRTPTFYRSPAPSLAKQTQSLYSLIEAVLLFCMQEWFRACRPVPLSILVALTSGKEHFLLLPLCSPLHALKWRGEDVRAVLTYTRRSDKNQIVISFKHAVTKPDFCEDPLSDGFSAIRSWRQPKELNN